MKSKATGHNNCPTLWRLTDLQFMNHQDTLLRSSFLDKIWACLLTACILIIKKDQLLIFVNLFTTNYSISASFRVSPTQLERKTETPNCYIQQDGSWPSVQRRTKSLIRHPAVAVAETSNFASPWKRPDIPDTCLNDVKFRIQDDKCS